MPRDRQHSVEHAHHKQHHRPHDQGGSVPSDETIIDRARQHPRRHSQANHPGTPQRRPCHNTPHLRPRQPKQKPEGPTRVASRRRNPALVQPIRPVAVRHPATLAVTGRAHGDACHAHRTNRRGAMRTTTTVDRHGRAPATYRGPANLYLRTAGSRPAVREGARSATGCFRQAGDAGGRATGWVGASGERATQERAWRRRGLPTQDGTGCCLDHSRLPK